MFPIFTSCKLGNVNDMREWDLSFGGIQKLVSTPCLNEELILGRPFLIRYIVSGKRERVVMSSCKFLLFVI